MKNKTPLVFMELLVMVLVFALAAALCLNCFVYADRLSRETAARDQAAFLAQNTAETLKSCRGNLAEAAELLGGTVRDDLLTVTDGVFSVEARKQPSPNLLLGQADIQVLHSETPVFSLAVCWQEVG